MENFKLRDEFFKTNQEKAYVNKLLAEAASVFEASNLVRSIMLKYKLQIDDIALLLGTDGSHVSRILLGIEGDDWVLKIADILSSMVETWDKGE